ncbi:MAG TPA: KpsF/GutQ family sugar-phosphate isomerase [Usitatibacter sp.]|jgi:arabinose-5-phosphate isomerase|nr:KpsF/GutQ family sugar-phosphate isomerase [Usitatibacter sp.]
MTNLLQPGALAGVRPDAERLLELARDVLDIEADAVRSLKQKMGDAFLRAHGLIMRTKGRVVVTGMGKSGHIARKIASTLASTGTPAFFMHPGEASHGDLGMITDADIVIAISYSGESDEILKVLPLIKRRGAAVIAITGRPQSTLATEADVHLDAAVEKEACPLNLAPTASTTATLALGDALAVALLEARGFRSEDFAMHHPGGSLGRRLLVHVADIMRKGEQLPRNSPDALLPEAIVEMTRKGIGMTAIVDDGDRLLGIFTDGDLRRTLEKHENIRGVRVGDVMTRNPTTIAPERLAAEAAQVLEQKSLGGRLVVLAPDGRYVGALTFHDLLAAGVV